MTLSLTVVQLLVGELLSARGLAAGAASTALRAAALAHSILCFVEETGHGELIGAIDLVVVCRLVNVDGRRIMSKYLALACIYVYIVGRIQGAWTRQRHTPPD